MESIYYFIRVYLGSRKGLQTALLLATCFASGQPFTPTLALAQELELEFEPESQDRRLVGDSELIFVGSVVHAESEWTGSRKLIQTHYVFSVEASVKGHPDGVLTLTEFGGKVGNYTMHVSHTPGYVLGQRYLVFARQGESGRTRTTGGPLGQLPVVESGQGTRMVRIGSHHPLSSLDKNVSSRAFVDLDRTIAVLREELERLDRASDFR